MLLGDVEQGVKIVREVRPLPNTFEPSEEFEQSVEREGATHEAAPVGQERRYMVSPDDDVRADAGGAADEAQGAGLLPFAPEPSRASERVRPRLGMPWYSYIIVSVMRRRDPMRTDLPGSSTRRSASERSSSMNRERPID